MPQVSDDQVGEEVPLGDLDEPDESKPELWPLLLPSELSQNDRALCHKGIEAAECTLRLAQVQDNLIDLRRQRRTLRSLRMYFKSNVVGQGQKVQTRSRKTESGVRARIDRAVRRYRLARAALLSLDPTGSWKDEYKELPDKENRGPGKEQDEEGVGDGRWIGSWIWNAPSAGGSSDPSEQEVNENVRHEWMTCRARADRWKEESQLLQEEMRRIIAFLEWKSTWWREKVGSRSGSTAVDIQRGIDGYARRQASTHHGLAVSLTSQWLPPLLKLKFDTTWAKEYSWATEIIASAADPRPNSSTAPNDASPSGPCPEKAPLHGNEQAATKPVDSDDDSGSESESGIDLDADDGESGDEFEYDDAYMS